MYNDRVISLQEKTCQCDSNQVFFDKHVLSRKMAGILYMQYFAKTDTQGISIAIDNLSDSNDLKLTKFNSCYFFCINYQKPKSK